MLFQPYSIGLAIGIAPSVVEQILGVFFYELSQTDETVTYVCIAPSNWILYCTILICNIVCKKTEKLVDAVLQTSN